MAPQPAAPSPLRVPHLPQPTLAPSTTLASGTTSRPTPLLTRNALASSSRQQLTSAEAYANLHQAAGSRRDKTSKPILDWLSRKLGRRATIGDATPLQAQQGRKPSLPLTSEPPAGLPATPIRDHSMTRTESHSLRSYSYANSVDRERRREANNPYPSLPVPRASDSLFTSIMSRSRTPSIRSEDSVTRAIRPRLSFALTDDESGQQGADDDASVRPIAPSHPASPTPTSILSRSASLLSPRVYQPPSPRPRPNTHHSSSTGLESSEGDRRRDSTSTKPTTIISFDSGPHIAHIAQAPSPVSSRQTRDLTAPPTAPEPSLSPQPLMQAPKHSVPHPRDNPRPLSAPEPNASTLTLASSTFALVPPLQLRSAPRTASIITTVTFADSAQDRPGSYHEYAGSVHQSLGGAHRDASVRAVRRKGSWESNESGWSWRAAGAMVGTRPPWEAPQGVLAAAGPEPHEASNLGMSSSESGVRDSFITARTTIGESPGEGSAGFEAGSWQGRLEDVAITA